MLYDTYLSHLTANPRSPLRRITFEQCLDDRALFICLSNLAIAKARRRAEHAAQNPPPLELT